ncbi:MAG: LamG domain-containing protein, partial [Winogradskyella sp.]|nr:LamG domain-containing protein [Winogradskyella sp.]
MKSKILFFAVVILTVMSYGQECLGVSFNPPALPSSFTYNYKTVSGITGWYDAADLPTTPPKTTGMGNMVGSIGIFEDLTYYFGGIKSYEFYVAPGVLFTGTADSLKDSNFHFEGTANFLNTPTTGGTKIYIYPDGELTFSQNFSVSSNEFVHNAGLFNIGVPGSFVADLSVTSNFYSYPDSETIVNGDVHFPGSYYNCGSLEAYGDIHTGGMSDFKNNCSTYIHGDFHLNGDYTNDGIMYFKGGVNFIASAIFYNTGVLIFDDLLLNNDQIVGQISKDRKPTLIVRNTATLTGGAAVIDHYFYNSSATPPPGGGFNSVCGTCTADIYIASEATVPTTPRDILKDCGADVRVGPPSIRATLDFDGIDDYVSTSEFVEGLDQVTIMAWVKSDAGNTGNRVIAGEEDGAKLWLSNGRPRFSITTQGSSIRHTGNGTVIPNDEWHHVAGIYSNTTGILEVYLDGKLLHSMSTGILGNPIATGAASLNTFEIGRLSKNVSNKEYFMGDIDEVRVFNKALTQDQLNKIIYQEIDEVAGNVGGVVVEKEIADVVSQDKISWGNLLAYYPMTDIISYERTVDHSANNRFTTLHNITTLQEQTAPLPYETKADGDWTAEGTWLHGDVWDIENIPNHDGTIVKINNKVTTTASHEHLALLIEENQSLTVNTDKEIKNTWYLELNGSLELNDDAQLVQGMTSDLVTGANGKILRRQDGTSNVYWYTYMSSPVGALGVTTLTDNNAATNNTNNTAFQFNTLKEGDGSLVQFTNALNEAGKISTRWMYTFENGLTYYDWVRFNPSTS